MTSVTSNLHQVQERIYKACLQNNRDPGDVRLLAVSKTKPDTMVAEAIAAGQLDFGENYLQDAMVKVVQFPQACWHFIGHIQSNKTKQIANHFDWVHSVASQKVARRLNDQRELTTPLNVLLQINVSDDPAKAGIAEGQAEALLSCILGLKKLHPRGLMTITEQTEDPQAQRRHFKHLAQILDNLNSGYLLDRFNQLSMGMTGDLESAIAEGATIVRIGTAIFGQR